MWKRLLRAVGYVALFLGVQIVAAVVLQLAGLQLSDGSGDIGLHQALTLCLLEALLLAAAAGLVWRRGGLAELGIDWRGPRQAKGWWQLVPVGLLVIGPSVIAAFADDRHPVIAPRDGAITATFMVLALLIGVAEELWFRGMVLASLEPTRGPWIAVIASAVLFGSPHLLSSDSGITAATALNAAAVTLAIAIPFACVRIASRSIVPLIGWHFAVDGWAFLHTASITAEGTPDISDASVALVIPALVSIGYLLWLRTQLARRAHSTL